MIYLVVYMMVSRTKNNFTKSFHIGQSYFRVRPGLSLLISKLDVRSKGLARVERSFSTL